MIDMRNSTHFLRGTQLEQSILWFLYTLDVVHGHNSIQSLVFYRKSVKVEKKNIFFMYSRFLAIICYFDDIKYK